MTRILLDATDVAKYYLVGRSFWTRRERLLGAVDGVDLQIRQGENLALVGESGCGKTTLSRLLSGLLTPTRGSIKFLDATDVAAIDLLPRDQQLYVRRNIQYIFQDPYSALNPRKTVRQILTEPLELHNGHVEEAEVERLLAHLGLTPPHSFLERYPHELSGGQRQRVVIARALSLHPMIVMADEPVSGLDTTNKVQVLNLLKDLQTEFGVTYVIVSHDLSILRYICDKVAVMYLGRIVEFGPTPVVLERPIHPYTMALLRSSPSVDPAQRDWVEKPPLLGDVPSPIELPSGCRFRTRCPYAEDWCVHNDPPLREAEAGHFVACPIMVRRLEPMLPMAPAPSGSGRR